MSILMRNPGALPLLLSLGVAGCSNSQDDHHGWAKENRDIRYISGSSSSAHTLDLFLPEEEEAARHPAVVYFHGGGWGSGSRIEEEHLLQSFLDAGWAAINVDYRLAQEAPAPAAVQDVRCALGYVVDTLPVDPRRIVVIGFSAGAHLALMVGLAPEADLGPVDHSCAPVAAVAGIVSLAGPTDVRPLLDGDHRRHWAVEWLEGTGSQLRGRLSPVEQVGPRDPPVLLVHGVLDTIVPFQQAVALRERLEESNVDYRLFAMENEDHDLIRGQSWETLKLEVLQFLMRH